MNIFPDIQYKQDDYRAELGRHLDDPLRKAICEILWHGTRQYQRIIAREGSHAQQEILRQVRSNIRQLDQDISTLNSGEPGISANIEKLRSQAEELAGREEYRRAGHGQLLRIDHSQRVAELMSQAAAQRNIWNMLRSMTSEKRQLLAIYRQADQRLTVALLTFMEEQARRAETPPAPAAPPVINVTVEAPTVNLEATIDMPSPEVTVNLPDRKTITTIERDHNGNIIGSEQIETDA